MTRVTRSWHEDLGLAFAAPCPSVRDSAPHLSIGQNRSHGQTSLGAANTIASITSPTFNKVVSYNARDLFVAHASVPISVRIEPHITYKSRVSEMPNSDKSRLRV